MKFNIKDCINDNALDLSLLELQDVPVREIAAVPRATILDLSCNQVTSLPLSFAPSLSRLVKLDLSRNLLTALPDNFGDLVNLRHLDLFKNELKTLPLSFSHLKALRWLDVKDNPLVPKIAQVAGPCTDASGCQAAAKNVVKFMADVSRKLEEEEKEKEAKKKEMEEKRIAEQQERAQAVKQKEKKAKKKKKNPKQNEPTKSDHVQPKLTQVDGPCIPEKNKPIKTAVETSDHLNWALVVFRITAFMVISTALLSLISFAVIGLLIHFKFRGTLAVLETAIRPILGRIDQPYRQDLISAFVTAENGFESFITFLSMFVTGLGNGVRSQVAPILHGSTNAVTYASGILQSFGFLIKESLKSYVQILLYFKDNQTVRTVFFDVRDTLHWLALQIAESVSAFFNKVFFS